MAVIIVVEAAAQTPPNWFFPERQRCLACRRYFGPLVVKRLFCRYACAGLVSPDPDVSTWPRYCRTRVNEPKARYNCPEEVSTRNHEHETIHVYECNYCGGWHIGHHNPREERADERRPYMHLKPRQRGGRR